MGYVDFLYEMATIRCGVGPARVSPWRAARPTSKYEACQCAQEHCVRPLRQEDDSGLDHSLPIDSGPPADDHIVAARTSTVAVAMIAYPR